PATGISSGRDDITLTVWDTETEPGPSAEMQALITQFERAHPGVHVNRVARSFNDYIKTVKLAASSSKAPDVLEGNEGYSVDAARLIEPLDAASARYGWASRFGAATLAPLRWTDGAKQWGSGHLWGVAQKAEVVGVFYDKKTLARLGLQVPKTFAAFEQALA